MFIATAIAKSSVIFEDMVGRSRTAPDGGRACVVSAGIQARRGRVELPR